MGPVTGYSYFASEHSPVLNSGKKLGFGDPLVVMAAYELTEQVLTCCTSFGAAVWTVDVFGLHGNSLNELVYASRHF